jgi:hypothetical protein
MKLTYILTALILCSACNKFLDQEPLSTATDQTTWKSEADANASVGASYALLRTAFNASIQFYVYGDLPTDEFTPDFVAGGDGNAYMNAAKVNWGVAVPVANTYDVRLKLRVYNNFYSAIAQSNRCLHFIRSMPESVFTVSSRNKYLGEAYFTRAFAYFYMARVWGDIPLDTTYYADNSAAPQMARTPQATVLAQCIADLDIARQYLGWKDGSSVDKVVRGDKGGVFALLAHLYAWKGDYDKCNAACDSLINSGTYSLLPAAAYMNLYKGQSDESIFEISNNSSSEALLTSASISGYTLCAPYLPGFTLPQWQLNNATVNGLYYDEGDIRFKQAFTVVSSGSTDYYSCIKYAQLAYVNNNTTYPIAKNNLLIFRLADIKLLKAEALAAKASPDEAGALAQVNEIRTRAGIPVYSTISGAALQDSIVAERGRELFLEGARFYDFVRLGRNTGHVKFSYINATEFAQGKYYWPLDPSLFLLNNKLTQTPYWQGKIQ